MDGTKSPSKGWNDFAGTKSQNDSPLSECEGCATADAQTQRRCLKLRKQGKPPVRHRVGKARRTTTRTFEYVRTFEAIGARIRHVREERDISQAELAAAVGTTAQNIANYEKSRATPSLLRLVRIARALDCMLLDLMPSEEP